jgi:hypothetical protein
MNNVTNVAQKIRQAPWRVQLQWIGLFLLSLVLMAMVAGIYLNVTVRATLAGREILSLQNTITTNKRINADMETKLAALTSVEAMQPRADALGFQPAGLDDITYVEVSGYVPPSGVNLSVPGTTEPATPVILPAYTESWFDYFMDQKTSSASTGNMP